MLTDSIVKLADEPYIRMSDSKTKKKGNEEMLKKSKKTGENVEDFLKSLDSWIPDSVSDFTTGDMLNALEEFGYYYEDNPDPLDKLSERIGEECKKTITAILKPE